MRRTFVNPAPPFVIPAEAGIQGSQNNALRALPPNALDPRLRGGDGVRTEPAAE